jgi:hypothetical protein
MTAQVSERLLYEGQAVPLRSTPLASYLKQGGKQGAFQSTSTANWRGYVGSWEIADNQLYLVGLSGTLKDGTAANVATVFPKSAERVFARWYSGALRIPQGALLEYVHAGFGSRYERELLLNIEEGVVMSTSVQENSATPEDGVLETAPRLGKRRGLFTRILALARCQ